MMMAMGTVANTVKVPHGLPAKAFTTTSASTARMMIMIINTPTRAMPPAAGPISERMMSPRDRPSRRVETNRTMESCTAPAMTTPARIHNVPGK